MYELTNNELTVQILDPYTDSKYLGSRYCVGGYVWQVIDPKHGKLLSGPQYPNPEPDTFHGQGAPDMFLKTLGGELSAVGEHVGVIGVGNILRTTAEPFHVATNRNVVAPIEWKIERAASRLQMGGEHSHRNWSYSLSRDVSLTNRAVRITTALLNQGPAMLPLCAFAHPFFPPTRANRQCKLSLPVMPFENPGLVLDSEGWISRKPDHDWVNGAYQILDYEATGDGMTITQKHDAVGQVVTVLDFLPNRVAIWGNDRTSSFEPFIERDMAPATTVEWSVEYRF